MANNTVHDTINLADGTMATLTGYKDFTRLDIMQKKLTQFTIGILASAPNEFTKWQEAWNRFEDVYNSEKPLKFADWCEDPKGLKPIGDVSLKENTAVEKNQEGLDMSEKEFWGDYASMSDEEKIGASASLDEIFGERQSKISYTLGVAIEGLGFLQTKEVSGHDVPQYGGTKKIHDLTWEQTVFGVKDDLQPIREYIEEIMASPMYIEHREALKEDGEIKPILRGNAFTIDEHNNDEDEVVYADLVGVASTIKIEKEDREDGEFFKLTVLKPVFGVKCNPKIHHYATQICTSR